MKRHCVSFLLGVSAAAGLSGDFLHLWSAPVFVVNASSRTVEDSLMEEYISLLGVNIPRQNVGGWDIQGEDVAGCLTGRPRASSNEVLFEALTAATDTPLAVLDPRFGARAPFDQEFVHVLRQGQALLYPAFLTVVSADPVHCGSQSVTRFRVRHRACQGPDSECPSLTDLWSMHSGVPITQLRTGIAASGMQPRTPVLQKQGTLHELFAGHIYIETDLPGVRVEREDLEVVLDEGLRQVKRDHRANGAFYNWQLDQHEAGTKWKARIYPYMVIYLSPKGRAWRACLPSCYCHYPPPPSSSQGPGGCAWVAPSPNSPS
jgi:hypothetical protein